jgi:hypothetical protein
MDASREELRGFFETVLPHLNEVQRRVVAGAMAAALGTAPDAIVLLANLAGQIEVTTTQALLPQTFSTDQLTDLTSEAKGCP